MAGLASASPHAPVLPPVTPGDPVTGDAMDAVGVGAGPIGGPGEGPSTGPGGGTTPTPTPSPTPTPTPTPSPGPGDDGTDGGAGLPAGSAQTFLDMLTTATTPEAIEAQNIILRRIALQGDVIPSRVPPPRNITEIGGYLNLLTTLNEIDMRSQVLAGILGVAGPIPPLGWIGMGTPLTFSSVVNDRPAGAVQPGLPVTIPVRSDFAAPLRSAMQALHDRGAMLPMVAGPLALPAAGGIGASLLDPLDYIGRTLRLAAACALTDATTDALALIRVTGTTDPFQLAARSTGTPAVAVPTADYDALQRSGSSVTTVAITAAPMVMLGPVLAGAGFYSKTPLPAPTATEPDSWAKLVNVGGLSLGTPLGSELRLLHSETEIAGSAFAAWQSWQWNGTAFSP